MITITTKQAATVLGVSPEVVRRYVRRGFLKPIRLTKQGWLFDGELITAIPNYKDHLTITRAAQQLIAAGAMPRSKPRSSIQYVLRLANSGKLQSVIHPISRYRLFTERGIENFIRKSRNL